MSMSQRARVVFADGSKQMAHNNEDLFQRWRMRREIMPPPERSEFPETHIEIFLPDLPPLDGADTNDLYSLVQDKYRIIADRLTRVNAQLKTRQPTVVYQRMVSEKAELAAAHRRAQSQIMALKQAKQKARSDEQQKEPATIAGLRALLEQRKAVDNALYDYLERLIECYGDVAEDL